MVFCIVRVSFYLSCHSRRGVLLFFSPHKSNFLWSCVSKGEAAAADDSESESLHSKIAELEAALDGEKAASATARAAVEAATAEVAAAKAEAAAAKVEAASAVTSTASVAVAAPAPVEAVAESSSDGKGDVAMMESMRVTIAELESALAVEKEKVAAAVTVSRDVVVKEVSRSMPVADMAGVVSENGEEAEALRARVGKLEAELERKDEELASAVAAATAAAADTIPSPSKDVAMEVPVVSVGDPGEVEEAGPLMRRVSDLEAALAEEKKAVAEATLAMEVAKAKAEAAEASRKDAEAMAAATATAAAAKAAQAESSTGMRSTGGFEGGQALRERVLTLEKALLEAKATAKIEVEAAKASVVARMEADAISRPVDGGEDGDVESMREVLMELEAQLARER